ncbi:uroporphyrinogen-III C-methyltransferase [Salinicola sp. DM10]|uniref:uroporphyrinogen-III C-methyltransferase n=1 Tax=Salinicola sp. DM10 TaxID=2815721 RepID=UPI001A8D3F66|nr:uroporphyrinogen-III C-methyltransferase [Salinicola sp. DM10]MCE3027712.1 uroporphyrinogen-III C-methyltransferase [Salinicola sp. DM10]
MSKQRNDQQPQSASASDNPADGDARKAEQDKTASSTAASTPDTAADTAGHTDPVKPDVAQPDASAEPSTSRASGKAASTAKQESAQTDAAKSAGTASQGGEGKRDAAKGKNKTSTKAAKPAGPLSRDGGGAASSSAKPGGSGGGGNSHDGSRSGGGGKNGKSSKLGLLALILVIVLAIAVAFIGYRGWQLLQQQQQKLDQVQSNRGAIDDLSARVGDLDQNRQQSLKMMRGEFDQYRQSLDKTLDKVLAELAKQQQADPREWLHAEAEYLLRLANQRLQLERDVPGAKALLEAADARLREADNPALVPIRRAIQSELASLDSVPVIDRTGIYLALMAQQEQLARLPLKQDIEQIAAGKGDAQPSGGWREQLAILGRELKDLVTVRRHDQPLEALITPEQESYLRQNVRMLLEQAQLALLKAEPKLYQASLGKAIELIKGYYDTDNQGVENALDKLSSLRDENVRPELPDISQSSQLLKQFIEKRFGNGTGGSNANGGQATQNGSAQGEGA